MPSPSDPSTTDAAAVPSIRLFQFDGAGVGALASAVNLFRGDVNLAQNLFTFPGRQPGAGLDVDVTVMYQSNVARDATLWNLDSPTGVLGLGWSLPLTSIRATSSGSPDPQTWTYVLDDNGSPTELVRQPQPTVLYTLPADIVADFQPNTAVTTDLRSAFGQTGLLVDGNAALTTADGVWTITDAVNQQAFTIAASTADPDSYTVCYGGQEFQLHAYRPWQIVYFPTFERWLVVTDDGIRQSFGGVGPDLPQGFRTSVGNSVVWDVWWGANGVPQWTGPSTNTSGQLQVASAWYLASTSNGFGDSVGYVYNGWDRDGNGLLPDVEQAVGQGGLPYTKAVYLTQVTDVFGRTAALVYDDKVWNESGPCEFSDPHRDEPSTAPNAYQDRYETKYLASIDLSAATGDALFQIQFSYQPDPTASGPESAIANVTTYTGPLYDNTFKRYLTAITMADAAGNVVPGYRYDYWLDPTATGSQPGALRVVTVPQGGGVSYAYTAQALTVCQRTQAIERPTQTPNGAPRVFYGDDYVVNLWFDAPNSLVTMQVFTWAGRWIPWQLDATDPTIYQGPFDSSSIDVVANSEFFVLHVDTDQSSLAWVFSKDAARPGQFLPATVDGVTTAAGVPTLRFPLPSGTVSYVGGDTFVAVAQMNVASSVWSCSVLTWRWSTQSWELTTSTPASYTWFAAQGEYLFALDWDGNVALSYLDGELTWHSSTPVAIDGFSPGNPSYVQVTAGAAMAVVNLVASSTNAVTEYQLAIVQWDADHVLRTPTTPAPVIEPHGLGTTSNWVPAIVDDTLVALNGYLMRYDGAQWLTNASLMVSSPRAGATQRYAYGPDYALQVLADGSGLGNDAAVVGFDPDAVTSSWDTAPAQPALPFPSTAYDNWPSAGGADYALLGPNLYYRGSATDWTAVVTSTQPTDISALVSGGGFDSQSMVNEGPAFLSYSLRPADDSTATVAQSLVLQNGAVAPGAPTSFASERMYTPSIEGPAGRGVSPQGPWVFVTYTSGADFETATEIALNQFAGDAVAGPVSHFPVTSVCIDDACQEPATTTYVPDSTQAACDPTGLIIKYYQTTVYPGTADPGAAPYGWTQSTYLNGLTYAGADYFDMLDGLLTSTQTFDTSGTLLESQQSSWEVVQLAASDPVDATAPPIQLHGGWVLQTASVSVCDGVSRTTAQTYMPDGLSAPYNGRPVTTSTVSFGGQGEQEAVVQQSTYAPEIDEVMRTLNMRSVVAQSSTTVQPAGGDPVTVRSAASTYAIWPSAVGGVWAPATEATFVMTSAAEAAFPFGTYQPGNAPPGWLLSRRVTRRTKRGSELESCDGGGTARSIIYSADLTFPVARVSNAFVGAAAYLGFASYEDTSSWTLTGTAPCSDDTYTGTTSRLLAAGSNAEVSTTVWVDGTQPYVIGYWYKTPPGFTPNTGSGCSYTTQGPAVSTLFGATDGAWAMQTIGVATSGAGTLAVTLANAGASDVLVDSVFVAPLVGGVMASTFDGVTQLVTGVTDTGGRTRWMSYDSFQRPTLHVGPTAAVQELALRFLSRQRGQDAFDPASPNADLTLHPADGGVAETFVDGGDWATRWVPGEAGSWAAAASGLTYTGSGGDALTYHSELPPTWALYFEVAVGSQAPAMSITVGGSGVSFANGTFGGWTGATALGDTSMARQWLLVAGDGVTLFFADGQLLYSTATGPAAGSALTISVDSDITLSHLAVLASPRLSAAYLDGCGRQRQAQALHGGDSLVSDVVYDPIGRTLATTRVIPASAGSGADLPVLAFRPGVVDVAGFLASTSSSWQMTGDAADYYRGQADGATQRSDDQGYPYRGTRWEPSPRRRIVETGLPGLPGAIHDVDTTTGADRSTMQYAYGANSGGEPTLPAGMYSQTTLTTPVKTVSSRVSDQLGQSVTSVVLDQTGAIVAQAAGVRSFSAGGAGPQLTLAMQSPNALVAGPQADAANFVTTTVADAADRAVSTTEPDAGETLFVYDACGRARFVRPAQGTGPAYYFYTTYDAVGRVLEQGTIDGAWDPSALAPFAAEADWPTPDVARAVSLTLSYDGDGNDPTAIGQKVSAVTTTPGPDGGAACVATERFGYDNAGRVATVELDVAGPTTSTGTAAYAHNNLGELVGLTFPSGSPLSQVVYTIDDRGRITDVGSSPTSPSDLATYTYTAEGQVETETLGAAAWTRTASYTSEGWVEQVTTTAPDDTTALTMAYTYNADSTTATRDVTFAFDAADEALSDTYTYDGQGRLVASNGSSDEAISSYDPNGNIVAVTQGGATQAFTPAAGCNQVESVTLAGSTTAVDYDARGRVVAALGRTFAYDDATNLTVGATNGTTAVQFGYASRHQRVLKQVDGPTARTTTYFTGASSVPIATFDGQQWSAFVYGPTGLIAVCADETYLPLKDNEHTVWAVVTPSALAARYVYLPFGGLVTADGPTPDATAFTFMSQEWDAELGVYNFRDRLYDPVLRRYLTPDPQRQFPSPYVFCANNPLTVTDPSGDISLWARIGIGIGMGALLIGGVVASVLTAGGAAPGVAAGEVALAGAEAGGAAIAAGAEAGVGAAAEGVVAGGAAAAEGGAAGAAGAGGAVGAAGAASASVETGVAGAAEISAGASSGSMAAGDAVSGAATLAANSSIPGNALYFGTQGLIGTAEGIGTSGAQYDIQNGRSFTAKGFFEAAGWGGLSGAIGGVLGGVPGMPMLRGVMSALTPLTQLGINVAAQGVAGAVSSDLTQCLVNVAHSGPGKPPWYKGLVLATAVGAGSSAALGAISGGFSGRTELGTQLESVGNQALDRATSAVDAVQAVARTSEARMCMGAAAFFVTAGFSVWGATAAFK